MNPKDYISMNQDTLWECNICGETKFDNSKLKKHVKKNHADIEKPQQTKITKLRDDE